MTRYTTGANHKAHYEPPLEHVRRKLMSEMMPHVRGMVGERLRLPRSPFLNDNVTFVIFLR